MNLFLRVVCTILMIILLVECEMKWFNADKFDVFIYGFKDWFPIVVLFVIDMILTILYIKERENKKDGDNHDDR